MKENECMVKGADGKPMKLVVYGPRLYVRKCKMPEPKNSEGKVLIALPDHSRDYSDKSFAWHEILAVGDAHGMPRTDKSKGFRKKLGIPKQLSAVFKKGQMVLCSDSHWSVVHSPYSQHEFFIDETMPMAVYNEGELK